MPAFVEERTTDARGVALLDNEPFPDTMKLRRRNISEAQFGQLEQHAAAIFSALGMDLDTTTTMKTPERFIRALFDATSGYEGDPKLITVFDTECHGGSHCRSSQVIEGPIPFFSLCEHHALPFYGCAYVGYIAHEHIIGVSKLTRLVRLFARRFSVQERIGQEVADTLEVMLEPHGIAVYLQAHHLCTQMRGVAEVSPLTRTTFWRGAYDSDASLRAEFLTACGLQSDRTHSV
ncbi:MAG: GTP cyclohydrolase I [Chloroflexota bacterium]|nr:GTP cyclohydrolase I [Chloroflexota bacterium]